MIPAEVMAAIRDLDTHFNLHMPNVPFYPTRWEIVRSHIAAQDAEIARNAEDADRWRYVVNHAEWIRDEDDTLMAVRLPERTSLMSVGARTDAIDAAMRSANGGEVVK